MKPLVIQCPLVKLTAFMSLFGTFPRAFQDSLRNPLSRDSVFQALHIHLLDISLNSDASQMLLLQCKECRFIVGESPQWLGTVPELELVVLKNATVGSTQLSQAILRVEEGSAFDSGLSYKRITCNHCKMELGRYYTSTNELAPVLSNGYAFDTNSIMFYQLESTEEPQLHSNTSITQPPSQSLPHESSKEIPDILERLNVLEKMVMYLHTQQAESNA